MFYNPNELLQYAKDHDMLLDLLTASYNNNIGFRYAMTNVTLSPDTDESATIHYPNPDTDDIVANKNTDSKNPGTKGKKRVDLLI